MILKIDPSLHHILKGNKRLFDYFMALDGKVYRQLQNRRTLSTNIKGSHFFIKQHFGIGWQEIIKNLLCARLAVISAKNEWQANQLLQKIGIATITIVAYGKRGFNPATMRSFLVSKPLQQCISLEKLCQHWQPNLKFKRWLIKKVAMTTRQLHRHGINHRDYYLCHLWLNQTTKQLYVMDLHRAQIRSKVPTRWLAKDIAALYFSSLDIGLTKGDIMQFLIIYFDLPLHDIFKQKKHLLQSIKKKAMALYHHNFSRSANIVV